MGFPPMMPPSVPTFPGIPPPPPPPPPLLIPHQVQRGPPVRHREYCQGLWSLYLQVSCRMCLGDTTLGVIFVLNLRQFTVFWHISYIYFFYSVFTVHFSSIDNVFHQLNALVIKTLKYSRTVW
jgi:hypothetical protein